MNGVSSTAVLEITIFELSEMWICEHILPRSQEKYTSRGCMYGIETQHFPSYQLQVGILLRDGKPEPPSGF